MIVVIRPFKSGGKFYPAGELIDPAGFKLLKSRIGEGKLQVVDEHNFEQTVRYLQIRQGVENAEELLNSYKEPKYDKEYLDKVKRLADKFEITMEDRSIEEVIAEIKEKQAEEKQAK